MTGQVTSPGRQRAAIVVTIAGLLLVLSAASVALGGGDGPATAEVATRATDEDRVPSQAFELFDGGTVDLGDFGGKPLVVNFWASWCPACVAELPELEAAHRARGDEVTFLGLANADDRARALELAARVGLSYTLADDAQGDLFRSFGLVAMPSTVFVTADGRIYEVFGGQLNETALLERVDGLLDAS